MQDSYARSSWLDGGAPPGASTPMSGRSVYQYEGTSAISKRTLLHMWCVEAPFLWTTDTSRSPTRGSRSFEVDSSLGRETLVVPLVSPGECGLETVASDDLVPLALFGGIGGVDDRPEVEPGLDSEPEAGRIHRAV